MELFFKILAVILAGVAAYFLWQGNFDNGFVAAVLGAVAFFLSVRFQVKGRLLEREAAREEEESRQAEAEIEETDEEIAGEEKLTGVSRLNEIPAREQLEKEQRTTDDAQKI